MKTRAGKLLLFAVALLLIVTVGCTQKEDETLSDLVNTLTQERKDLEDKLSNVESRLNETETKLSSAEAEANAVRTELEQLKSAPTPAPVVVTETKEVVKEVSASGEYAVGVGCTVNGGMTALLNGSTQVQCVAKIPDGYAFDHWEVDGAVQDAADKTLTLNASKTTVIEAVCHERHVLKCINCYFQFLTEKGNASGKKYKEFDFEEGYSNPVTRKKETGGLISFYITAEIPSRQEVDYWLINGVKYQFPVNVTKFRVENLDEATVYEVVFKNQTRKQTPSSIYPAPTPGR